MPSSRGGDRRVAALVDALRPHLPQSGVLRVPAAARAAHLAARRASLPPSRPMVVVARTDEEAHRLADDLAAWVGGGHVRTLPERAALPLERALPEHDESAERLSVLADLGGPVAEPGRHRLAAGVRPAHAGSRAAARLADERRGRGARSASATLLERLVAGGYEPSVEVTGIGEFAHRGGLIDAWPPGASDPVRVELFGDEVESIRSFDAMTQASRRRLEADRPRARLRVPARRRLGGASSSGRRRRPTCCARTRRGWRRARSARPPRRGPRSSLPDRPPTTSARPRTPCSPTSTSCGRWPPTSTARPRTGSPGSSTPGELPPDWPAPYEAVATPRRAGRRARPRRWRRERPTTPATRPRRRSPAARTAPARGSLELAAERAVLVTTDQASRVGELLDDAGHPTTPGGRAARRAQRGRSRARPWLAERGLRPCAERPACCSPTASCSARPACGG